MDILEEEEEEVKSNENFIDKELQLKEFFYNSYKTYMLEDVAKKKNFDLDNTTDNYDYKIDI